MSTGGHGRCCCPTSSNAYGCCSPTCDNGFPTSILLEIANLDAQYAAYGSNADGSYVLDFWPTFPFPGGPPSFPPGCSGNPINLLATTCCSWLYGNPAAATGDVYCAQFYVSGSLPGSKQEIWVVLDVQLVGTFVWHQVVSGWTNNCCFNDMILTPYRTGAGADPTIDFIGGPSRAHVTGLDPCPGTGVTCACCPGVTMPHYLKGVLNGNGTFIACGLEFSFPAMFFQAAPYTFDGHTHTEPCKWIDFTGSGTVAAVLTLTCGGGPIVLDFYFYRAADHAEIHYQATIADCTNPSLNATLAYVSSANLSGTCTTAASTSVAKIST